MADTDISIETTLNTRRARVKPVVDLVHALAAYHRKDGMHRTQIDPGSVVHVV